MDVRLNGKTALITGGSLGMGRAMALQFGASGAEVAIVARRPEVLEEAKAEIAKAGAPRVECYSCDVADGAAVKAMFAKVTGDFGKVDILVNNAGTSQAAAFEEITDEVWQADLDLKLFSAIRLCRLAFPGMKERKWGRIINVLNSHAKAPRAGGAPTAVSRAAGMALTKVLAGEGAPHNVLVNALCTGLIVSDQWRRRHQREGAQGSFEDYLGKMGQGIPLGRVGEAEEFANIACFLASDAASYITGTAINVDGNLSPVV